MAEKRDYLDIVRKMMLLASHNPNETEAKTAFLKAQQLMVEHAISEAAVADIMTPTSKEVKKHFWYKGEAFGPEGKYHRNAVIERWERNLWWTIADNFRCKALYYTGRGMAVWGHPEDLILCVAVAEAALCAAKESFHAFMIRKDYKQELSKWRWEYDKDAPLTQNERNLIRNSFLNGYQQGLNDLYKKQVTSQSYALMVVTPTAVTDFVTAEVGVSGNIRIQKLQVLQGIKAQGRVRGREFVPVLSPKLLGK